MEATFRRGGPHDRRLIAQHEAGHAVAAVVLGIPFRCVDMTCPVGPDGEITPARLELGWNLGHREAVGMGADALMPDLICAFAGPQAEWDLEPTQRSTGHHEDDYNDSLLRLVAAFCTAEEVSPTLEGDPFFRRAWELVCSDGRINLINAVQKVAIEKASALVVQHRETIRNVAVQLEQRKRLTEAKVIAIVRPQT